MVVAEGEGEASIEDVIVSALSGAGEGAVEQPVADKTIDAEPVPTLVPDQVNRQD